MKDNIKEIIDKLERTNNLNLEYMEKLEAKEKEYDSLEDDIDNITDTINDLCMKRSDYIRRKSNLLGGIIGGVTGLGIPFTIYSIIKFYCNQMISEFNDIYFILFALGGFHLLYSFFISYLLVESHLKKNSLLVKKINEDIEKQRTLYRCKEKELNEILNIINDLNRRIDMNDSLVYSYNNSLIDEYQMEHNLEIESCLNKEDLLDDIKCEYKCKKRILNK